MAKYKNKNMSVNGLNFDSIKEGKRYINLLEKERNGEISALQTQVKYVLIPSQYESYERYGKKGQRLKDGRRNVEREIAYIADFVYVDNSTGKTVIEDVKGYKNKKSGAYAIFTIKRKLLLYLHGIRIKEV